MILLKLSEYYISSMLYYCRATSYFISFIASFCLVANLYAGNNFQNVSDYYAEDDLTEITISDPWEGFNRKVDTFNYIIDGMFLKPAAKVYVDVVPNFLRNRVSSVLSNIGTTVTFGDFAIQGNAHNAMNQFWRFVFNSTLGIFGLFDVASEFGLQDQYTDGDLTYRQYCAEEGMYIVWPILGPASARSSLGRMLDIFLNPIMMFANHKEEVIYLAATTVNKRAQMLDLTQGVEMFSIDRYSINKSAFLQNRHYMYMKYQPDVDKTCARKELE